MKVIMMTRKLVLFAVLMVSLTIIGDGRSEKGFAGQANKNPASLTANEQTASADPKAGWEYRILTSPMTSIVQITYRDGKGNTRFSPGPYLEEEINKLAVQGYAVESFQPVTSIGGGGGGAGFTLNSSAEIVVLMKRTKK